MKIQRPCFLCGMMSETVELDERDVERWRDGEMVQHVWPNLTPGQRETIISGAHEKCFDEVFADPADEAENDGALGYEDDK